MPRKPWVAEPHEADKFCNVYIDESSQTKWQYLVLGGIIVPHSHVELFERDIIDARDPMIAPFNDKGEPRVIKWTKVNAYNIEAYKKVFDAFWRFEVKHGFLKTDKHVDLSCLVVDTTKKSLRATGEGNIEIGFDKEIYFLCAAQIGKRFKDNLFHIYLDRRSTSEEHSLSAARDIMNLGARKHGDTRVWPFRRLAWDDPERCQALQVVDICIGALAYKLNGHYDQPDANKARKEMCDYILNKAKVFKPFETTKYSLRRFTVVHRDGSPYEPPRYIQLHREKKR